MPAPAPVPVQPPIQEESVVLTLPRTSIIDSELQGCSLVLVEQTIPELLMINISMIRINIIKNNTFLTHTNNMVYYSPERGANWTLEKTDEGSIYYIRSSTPLAYGEKYLGCPNRNNRLYLYTTKNRFTRWRITKKDDLHTIEYAGEKFNPDEVSLIVARYMEDVHWVSPYNDIAYIYNKGRNDISGIIERIIPLENIGREGHTYLNHIINNYSELRARNIFVQGCPFTHNNTILYGIDNYDQLEEMQPLGLVYLRDLNIPPPEITERCTTKTVFGLEYMVLKINDTCEYHSDNAFVDNGIMELIANYKNTYKLHERKKYKLPEIPITCNFLDRCKYHKPRQQTYMMTFSGLFSVSNDVIYKNSVETYFNICTELTDKDPQGGENGYILERLWLYLFDYNQI